MTECVRARAALPLPRRSFPSSSRGSGSSLRHPSLALLSALGSPEFHPQRLPLPLPLSFARPAPPRGAPALDTRDRQTQSQRQSCLAFTGRASLCTVPLLVLLLQLLLLLLLLQLLLLLLLNVVPADVAVHGDLLRGAVGAHGAREGLLAGVCPDVAAQVVAAPEGLSAEGARAGDARRRGRHLGATAGGGGRGVGQEEGGVRLLKELQLQERSRGHIQEARSEGEALPAREWQWREGGGK